MCIYLNLKSSYFNAAFFWLMICRSTHRCNFWMCNFHITAYFWMIFKWKQVLQAQTFKLYRFQMNTLDTQQQPSCLEGSQLTPLSFTTSWLATAKCSAFTADQLANQCVSDWVRGEIRDSIKVPKENFRKSFSFWDLLKFLSDKEYQGTKDKEQLDS